jgi:hypothetical protein
VVLKASDATDAGVLTEQVGELLEGRLLVVNRQHDQTAGAVTAVHDLLILLGRRLGPW